MKKLIFTILLSLSAIAASLAINAQQVGAQQVGQPELFGQKNRCTCVNGQISCNHVKVTCPSDPKMLPRNADACCYCDSDNQPHCLYKTDRLCKERCQGQFCVLQDAGPYNNWFECQAN